jgi:hypothetical protein
MYFSNRVSHSCPGQPRLGTFYLCFPCSLGWQACGNHAKLFISCDEVSLPSCQDWPWTAIILILASQVDRITEVSYYSGLQFCIYSYSASISITIRELFLFQFKVLYLCFWTHPLWLFLRTLTALFLSSIIAFSLYGIISNRINHLPLSLILSKCPSSNGNSLHSSPPISIKNKYSYCQCFLQSILFDTMKYLKYTDIMNNFISTYTQIMIHQLLAFFHIYIISVEIWH